MTEKVIERHIFDFGKIDYNHSGRKNCPVTVELELRQCHNGYQNKNYVELSICGNVWNPRKTDCYSCGQNLDDINQYLSKNEVFKKLYTWWKQYHLNGLHAGTPEQEKALADWRATQERPEYDYTKCCNYLQSVNLYEVDYNGKPYRYGYAWLVEDIPEEVIAEIKETVYQDKLSNLNI